MTTFQSTRVAGLFLLLMMLLIPAASAQDGAEVFAVGLNGPLGMTFDDQGQLWVAEQGTGQNDGRVSVITTDGQVHAFVEGLPSEAMDDEVTGPTDVFFDPDGNLVVIQGEGTDPLSMSLLTFDVAGFTPGDAPQSPDAAVSVVNLGDFVLARPDIAESNPYRAVYGPDGDLFIVDAAANALLRQDADTGGLDIFARFDDLPNPTPVGPPFFNAVPTGLAFNGDYFLVASLTGFPFLSGAAKVYAVDPQGNVSVFREGLTTLTDLALDPIDGRPVVTSFAEFDLGPPPTGFTPGTGASYKLHPGGLMEPLAAELNLISSATFSDDGDLFLGSLFGMVLRVAPTVAQDIARLVNQINDLEAGEQIGARQAAILRARLDEARRNVVTGDNAAALRTLRNFAGFVQLLMAESPLLGAEPAARFISFLGLGHIDTDVGETLLSAAADIMARLSSTSAPRLSGESETYASAAKQQTEADIPATFILEQNYPNPFNPSTTIRFEVPEATYVTLTIYNVLGQTVRTLVNEDRSAGTHTVTWDARNDVGARVPSGMYLYHLEADGQVQSRTMLLMK